MQPLRSVLDALADRPDVAGALVLSDEGLVVEASLPPGLDPEAVAALAATAVRQLVGLGEALRLGASGQVVVDGPDGAFLLHRLGNGATLLVLAGAEGELGSLLYDVRRHAPALEPLV
jgi:predicted regulator of Ras-like GTPase activity (Roadblock/LC7/MglB family)